VEWDDAFHRLTVRIAQGAADEIGGRPGHSHRLVFERLAHTAPPPVDGGAYADLRPAADVTWPASLDAGGDLLDGSHCHFLR
jgi:hypothetical protein